MIKAVIFDLGRTLIPFDFARGYAAMAALCPCDPREIRNRLAGTNLVERFETGLIEPHAFVDELSRLLEFKVDYSEFCRIWSSIFLPETLIPESMVQGISRSYKVLLLSNTNAIHFDMIRESYPLLRHFDSFVLSYEVGALKPAREIYWEAIARAGCRPEECFYTDDIAEYVAAAKTEGMDAVQFQSFEQLEHELRSRGVTW
jgi:putative hydrolase of the HAD superfamily